MREFESPSQRLNKAPDTKKVISIGAIKKINASWQVLKMRFLFVNPNVNGVPYINLGIACLSAYLKSAGHETGLIDMTFGCRPRNIVSDAERFEPDVICFSSKSTEYPKAVEIAKMLRHLGKPMICGGIHATIDPNDAIKDFDGVAIGEGELSLLELARRLGKKNYFSTPGFWFRKNGRIIRNRQTPLIENIDTLPYADRGIFDYGKYLKARDMEADFMFTRGCPFNCTYCINHKLHKIYKNKNILRFHSVKYVIGEIQDTIEKYKITSLKIEDDTFNANHKWLRELCMTYAKEINLPFECNLRADLCTKEMFSWLGKAGCSKVNIGIESGSEKIRRGVLRRNMTDEQIINAFKWSAEEGIHTMSFNMVGLPFETAEDINKTIELNKKASPDSIQASVFVPFRGTELYDICKKNDWVDDKKTTTSYYTATITKYPNMSTEELLETRKRFSYNCYKDKSKIKANMLLLREKITPFYLKHGNKIPAPMKKMIYKVIWHNKMLKFLSK